MFNFLISQEIAATARSTF